MNFHSDNSHDQVFPTTQWTLIDGLKSESDTVAQRALEEICRRYRYPLYCYARRFGLLSHDAEDALQDFFVQLFERDTLRGADVLRGKLRSLLLTAFKNALINRHHHNSSSRQGGRVARVSLDELGDEARYERERVNDTPERLYERKWALELLNGVMNQLRDDYARQGKSELFQALAPILSEGGSGRGEDLAQKAALLGTNDGALRVALHRLRKDYRTRLLQEVSLTVEHASEAKDEVKYLLGLFG